MSDEASNRVDAANRPAPSFLRSGFDYLLIGGLICLVPLLGLHCYDLLVRTDLKLFIALPFFAAVLFGLSFQLSPHSNRSRCWCSIVLLVLASCVSILAALWFSPWLAWCGAALLVLGWMLERFGALPWYATVRIIVPVVLFLLAPIGDASDWTRRLEIQTAESSGVLLDMLGVPQLVTNDSMQLRFDVPLKASFVCRGIASPYLLLALAVVLGVLTRRSVALSIPIILSVPLWAWFGATLHMTFGAYLWDQWDKSIFVGYRNILAQVSVLLMQLGCIWMLQKSLQRLLSPFSNYSATTSFIHKFFNWAVYWPARDPLRKRRALPTAAELARDRGSFSGHRNTKILLGVLGFLFSGAAGLSVKAVLGGQAKRLSSIAATPEEFESTMQNLELPENLQAVRQLNPMALQYDVSAAFSDRYKASWAFADGLQKVNVTVTLPHRGFYPLETNYLTPLSRIGEPRQSATVEQAELGAALVDDIVLLDELYGRSFLCYVTFSLDDATPMRTLASGASPSLQSLRDTLTLQPTLVSVAIFVEGTKRMTDEQRDVYRNLLLQFCGTIREPLQAGLAR